MTDYNDIKNQAQFVTELMLRLNKNIKDDKRVIGSDLWVDKYTQKQADIKRIRRELLELSRMLNP